NVGIGDTTPNSKLDVVDSTVGNVIASFTNLGGGGGASNKGLTIATESDGGSIRTVGTSGGGGANMSFKTANSERMRIDSSGNVGIGLTNPQSLLHLDASSNAQIRFL
ncbi:MAG: hypothetical protein EBW93_04390, partial [Betaproteobacteria bacterium]|nr:hypothetical protein [Betaproteobacteria bacterium]